MFLRNSILYKKIEDLNEIQEVVSFQEKIWGSDTVTPLPQLVAASHHGGIILGAFHAGNLIGFSYGFTGFRNHEPYLVSHMTGVIQDYHNKGIGLELKLKQRDWAIEYGYRKIVWTYDPLEARNAHFNLNKLGAYARTFIPSYYGEMNDKLNKGLPTDRLLSEWDICSNRVKMALERLGSEDGDNNYKALLETGIINGLPYPLEEKQLEDEKGYLVPIPAYFQYIKKTDIEVAKAWRLKLASVLSITLKKGYVITGILRKSDSLVHSYIIEKNTFGGTHHE